MDEEVGPWDLERYEGLKLEIERSAVGDADGEDDVVEVKEGKSKGLGEGDGDEGKGKGEDDGECCLRTLPSIISALDVCGCGVRSTQCLPSHSPLSPLRSPLRSPFQPISPPIRTL